MKISYVREQIDFPLGASNLFNVTLSILSSVSSYFVNCQF